MIKKKILLFGTLILTSIGIFSLSLGANKTEDLTEKFITLSREVVNQSLFVPETLEKLKKTFIDCKEGSHADKIKSACQERINNYQKLRSEFLPTKLEISLTTGDVHLKKIGEVSYYLGPCGGIGETTCMNTGDEYEVNIPKYDFTFRFPLSKDKNNEQALKERTWVQSGNIAIPSENLGENSQNPWLKDKHYVSNIIGFYTIPEFTGDDTLRKVGEEYRKVYQEVYRLRDWRAYMKIVEKNSGDNIRDQLTGNNLNNWEENMRYIISGGKLPIMTYQGGNAYFNVQGIASLYGINESVDICGFSAENAYLHTDILKDGWIPLPNCQKEQRSKWGSYQGYTYYPLIFREKKHPQIIKVWISNGIPPATGKRINQ